MLTAMWATKGGQGVSVTSALAAQAASKSALPSQPVLLVDLRGDQPAIFGASEVGPGLGEWSKSDLSTRSLERTVEELSPTLSLLPLGHTPLTARRAEDLAEYLEQRSKESPVVVDLGAPSGDEGTEAFRQAIMDRADESVLVTRKCYLALRRSVNMPNHPTKMVVLSEEGRALTTSDCERAVGAKAVTIQVDPDIARAVDAGMLRTRVPNDAVKAAGQIVNPSPPAGATAAGKRLASAAGDGSAQVANGGIEVSVSPAQASPQSGSRLCGHPLPSGGTCTHKVTRGKCAAGHSPR